LILDTSMDQKQISEIGALAHRVMDLQEDRLFVYKRFMMHGDKQLTRIIRLSLFGVVVLLVAMILLAGTFTTRMDTITLRMGEMSRDVSGMSADFAQVTKRMTSLESAVSRMNQHVAEVPSIRHHLTVGSLGSCCSG